MRQQKLADVIAGLQAACAFFSGMTRYLGIDNFPAAVAEPDPLHPRLTSITVALTFDRIGP